MEQKSMFPKLSEKYQNELIENLKKFVAINSVYDESTVDETNPFGAGVTKALQFIEELAKKDGFKVTNYANKIVEILIGEGDKNITIMAHADVVPAGDTGWKQDPFTMTDKKGVLCGRGVADDKGPLLAAYYGLRTLVDNHLLGDYTVRFLVGGNEESGSAGMIYYFEELKKPQPTYGFSPDAEYPLIFAEKGIINFKVTDEFEVPEVISIHGGTASNSVIEKCIVRMKVGSPFADYVVSKGYDVEVNKTNKYVEIKFIGKSAHGSTPEEGINAGMIALEALGFYYENKDLERIVSLYKDLYGKGCNVYTESKEMGKNSLNVGIIDYEDNKLSMIINFRHVDKIKQEEVINNFTEASKPSKAEVIAISPLLYYPKDSVLVATLLTVYQEETGDYATMPKAIGGGTYAKEADNVVAFGMEFPGWNSMMHSPGESCKKEDLFKSIAIYARAIYELGKKL